MIFVQEHHQSVRQHGSRVVERSYGDGTLGAAEGRRDQSRQTSEPRYADCDGTSAMHGGGWRWVGRHVYNVLPSTPTNAIPARRLASEPIATRRTNPAAPNGAGLTS